MRPQKTDWDGIYREKILICISCMQISNRSWVRSWLAPPVTWTQSTVTRVENSSKQCFFMVPADSFLPWVPALTFPSEGLPFGSVRQIKLFSYDLFLVNVLLPIGNQNNNTCLYSQQLQGRSTKISVSLGPVGYEFQASQGQIARPCLKGAVASCLLSGSMVRMLAAFHRSRVWLLAHTWWHHSQLQLQGIQHFLPPSTDIHSHTYIHTHAQARPFTQTK